jgi:hypothetical protein
MLIENEAIQCLQSCFQARLHSYVADITDPGGKNFKFCYICFSKKFFVCGRPDNNEAFVIFQKSGNILIYQDSERMSLNCKDIWVIIILNKDFLLHNVTKHKIMYNDNRECR